MSARILAFNCSSKSGCGIFLCHGGEDEGKMKVEMKMRKDK